MPPHRSAFQRLWITYFITSWWSSTSSFAWLDYLATLSSFSEFSFHFIFTVRFTLKTIIGYCYRNEVNICEEFPFNLLLFSFQSPAMFLRHHQIDSVVLRFSKMKTVTNLYILNLAFADEIFLIGLPALIFTMHIGEWIFGVFFCKLYMISTSITQFTSSIFLVIMSADRWVVVGWEMYSN